MALNQPKAKWYCPTRISIGNLPGIEDVHHEFTKLLIALAEIFRTALDMKLHSWWMNECFFTKICRKSENQSTLNFRCNYALIYIWRYIIVIRGLGYTLIWGWIHERIMGKKRVVGDHKFPAGNTGDEKSRQFEQQTRK